jgi:hypothetical protein
MEPPWQQSIQASARLAMDDHLIARVSQGPIITSSCRVTDNDGSESCQGEARVFPVLYTHQHAWVWRKIRGPGVPHVTSPRCPLRRETIA